ncbi:RNA polymerase sigma factor [Candidatus Magnetomonas plexicatena]|uniref:RNA polymerase sigma factor n=1 Tax=Candidatus Magnetomonas plexicatena TaxID=2552947 RepID=UPI001C787CD7|nr:RNA polymerase sigma factor [Nitrospirales bacterium LBB_01]
MDEDNRLIDSYLSGNEEAVESLIKKYQKEVYSLSYRVVSDMDEAKDITQKALISAVKELKNFKKTSSFKTWLYRITVNTALNHMRGNSLIKVELTETITSNEPGPVSSLIEKERERLLKSLLAALPVRQRLTVILRVYKDLSIAETAAVMGCSEGAVKAHYHSAIKKLRISIAGKDVYEN